MYLIPLKVAHIMAALVMLALSALALSQLSRPVTEALKRLCKGGARAFVFAVLAVGAVYVGGSKHIIGGITFRATDPELVYIADAGSYVTNDYVRVAYTKSAIVPSSASIVVERRRLDQSNDVDWVEHLTTTFAASPSPFDISFAAATNYNWVVYTDWTPGPSVVTNGVWHTWWAAPTTNAIIINGRHIIPIRTLVREDAETIATPKARKDQQ